MKNRGGRQEKKRKEAEKTTREPREPHWQINACFQRKRRNNKEKTKFREETASAQGEGRVPTRRSKRLQER